MGCPSGEVVLRWCTLYREVERCKMSAELELLFHHKRSFVKTVPLLQRSGDVEDMSYKYALPTRGVPSRPLQGYGRT